MTIKQGTEFPYSNIAEHQFWKSAVSRLDPSEIDPHWHSPSKFKINQQTKVASAGSCFAQRIAENLQLYGFNYYLAEPGPMWLSTEQRAAYNYGSYSARYGNIYTTLQLNQLMKRVNGDFEPKELYWQSPDGIVDPFRPDIQPNNFMSVDELIADRESHFSAIKTMFKEMDVFVFTLGLTEGWCSSQDGAAYPVCPGKRFGTFDSQLYEFRNISVADNVRYLSEFLEQLFAINNDVKVLLTVSPVPLVATMEDHHVIQSTTYSKSVLRVVAEEIRNQFSNVDYFSSYEIFTACSNNHLYFTDDKRTVTPAGVSHAMRCFFDNFTDFPFDTLVAREKETHDIDLSAIEPCDDEKLSLDIEKQFDQH